jgi:hypothetical protein
MGIAMERGALTRNQRKEIRRYVDELFDKRLEVLKEYFDVDKGLSVRPEIAKRLSRTRRSGKRIAHAEFWSKATKR